MRARLAGFRYYRWCAIADFPQVPVLEIWLFDDYDLVTPIEPAISSDELDERNSALRH